MKLPHVILLLLSLLTISCNTRKLRKISINSAVAARYDFKVGTYWVYRDSVTGGLDSFAVAKSLHYSKLTPDSYKGPYDVEIIDIPVAHYYNGVRSPMVSSIQLMQDSCLCIMLLGDSGRSDSAATSGGVLPYPLKNATSFITINGVAYNNVAVRGFGNFQYLCNEDALLIKVPAANKGNYPCTSLELLRYNIVR